MTSWIVFDVKTTQKTTENTTKTKTLKDVNLSCQDVTIYVTDSVNFRHLWHPKNTSDTQITTRQQQLRHTELASKKNKNYIKSISKTCQKHKEQKQCQIKHTSKTRRLRVIRLWSWFESKTTHLKEKRACDFTCTFARAAPLPHWLAPHHLAGGSPWQQVAHSDGVPLHRRQTTGERGAAQRDSRTRQGEVRSQRHSDVVAAAAAAATSRIEPAEAAAAWWQTDVTSTNNKTISRAGAGQWHSRLTLDVRVMSTRNDIFIYTYIHTYISIYI